MTLSPAAPAPPAAPVELVIFDCDGVLVDSERLAIGLNIEMLADYGYRATEQEIIDHFVGRSLPAVIERIEAMVGRPVPEWRWRRSGSSG